MSMDDFSSGVYICRVKTPTGDYYEVESCGVDRLCDAIAFANRLARWIAVECWDSRGELLPDDIAEIRREIREVWPDIDFAACRVAVVLSTRTRQEQLAAFDARPVERALINRIRVAS